jgi:hypothetical protein
MIKIKIKFIPSKFTNSLNSTHKFQVLPLLPPNQEEGKASREGSLSPGINFVLIKR